ncbi:deoxyribodipyrimidine photo-lyase [Lacinutrix neustonica]|uniref:deoxyribodipyrimidine photo-lyase n=1 Tax=Lacinutrix neustonica TaxID=2980107 RepID=UPI0028BF3596|nr:deoxyribodipyrimidine photo-lyase [Lacinutrix neustonica]
MSNKEELQIVWLKRDLRLTDNEAIYKALYYGKRVLLLYLFEDFLLHDKHYSERHWNFVKQSIEDLNSNLKNNQSKVLAINDTIESCMLKLQKHFNITTVYSHQETGIKKTFDRDLAFLSFCKKNNIQWIENVNNGVFRGIKNRKTWIEDWEHFIMKEDYKFLPRPNQLISIEELETLKKDFNTTDLKCNESKTIRERRNNNRIKIFAFVFKGTP